MRLIRILPALALAGTAPAKITITNYGTLVGDTGVRSGTTLTLQYVKLSLTTHTSGRRSARPN